jgi:hypothetical protein
MDATKTTAERPERVLETSGLLMEVRCLTTSGLLMDATKTTAERPERTVQPG